jgi:glutamyl-tRNA reductase
MLHGALAELHAADAEQRMQLASTVSRLFLRSATTSPKSSDAADTDR